MANFCSECGSALSPDARFCATCGAAITTPAVDAIPARTIAAGPVPSETVAAHPSSAASPHEMPEIDAAAPTRPTGLLLGGAALLAIAIAGGAWLGLSSTTNNNEAAQDIAAVESGTTAETATLYAVAEANLRDRASLAGSKVVGSLKRGEKASGTLVTDERGKQWLKVDGSGHFISLANLANAAPPTLATLDGSDRITASPCNMLETPSSDAATKTTLKSGAAVRLVGMTADGFTEFGLPGGGVGYIPATSSCATEPSAVKGAIANNLIQFNEKTCDLGPELELYFEKARQSREGQNAEESEEEYIFPVEKRFRGLRVNALIIGYEWQGVAFADSAAKVQTVFRGMGHKIDKDGIFLVPDEIDVGASIRPTDADTKSRGQSQLVCGI